MAFTKKIFVGTLFQFTNIGAEEVISSFRKQFSDETEAPFVSYNEKTQLFSCDVSPDDQSIIPLLNAQLNTYVTLHGRKPNGPLESDRLIPIVGTTFQEEARDIKPRELEPNPLFELDYSSEEEDPLRDNQIYWKPTCGDISILSADIVAEIADATGTFFIPDHVGQRVQLTHGNPHLALQKLERLEKVLTLVNSHKSHATSSANGNRLFLNTGSESTLRFVRPAQPMCGFDRIILDYKQLSVYDQIILTEVRLWKNGQRITPLNLDLEGVSLTTSNDFSEVLKVKRLRALGDIGNGIPRTQSKADSQPPDNAKRPVPPTKFLGQRETERVEEWRERVDPDAAPTLPPAEPVPEEAKTLGRRRVAEDSDDEESEDSDNKTAAPKQSQMIRIPQNDARTSQSSRKIDSLNIATSKQHTEEVSWDSQDVTNLERNKFGLQPDSTSNLVVRKKSTMSAENGRFQSKNMFDLIDDNDDVVDSEELNSEGLLTDRSNEKVKQPNVTFQEPKSIIEDSVVVRKHPSLRRVENSSKPVSNPDRSTHTDKKISSATRPDTARQHSSHSYGRSSIPQTGTIRPMPEPMDVVKTTPTQPRSHSVHRPQSGNRSDGHNLLPRRRQNLIDVSAEKSPSEPVMPPPGFFYRSDASSQQPAPLVAVPQKPHHCNGVQSETGQNPGSVTPPEASTSTNTQNVALGYNPQYSVPKRNIHFLREQAAAGLRAQIEAENSSNVGTGDNGLPPNRIHKDDEYSSRKYRKTMSQKMAKPNKGKKSSGKQETKAEQQARIAKAKADAYGDTTPAKARSSKSLLNAQHSAASTSDDISARKRQIVKKNQAMADMHQDVLTDGAIHDVAAGLVEDLTPILEATRAFKGKIKIEFQLGQALVLKNNRVDEGRFYTPKEWIQLLNGKSRNDTKVTFTNILTQNGCDIDRMLEMKADKSNSKLWHNKPAAHHLEFEFSCQDKSGCDFILLLDQEGNHSLNKNLSTIGQVAIHMPSQIWDACAVVSGTMKLLRPSEDVLSGVEQFKETVYVPDGEKAIIYYRLPHNNAFTIKSIVAKRRSIHDCVMSDQNNIELRITEVKVLTHSSNPTDKKLYRSQESSFDTMVRDGRLHYEVAIADKSLEKSFEANPTIEIGELALIATDNPDGKIFNFNQAQGLVRITAHMLERIDWMGAQNIGTLRRYYEHAADQRATIVNTLPPNINRNLAIPMGTTAPPTIAPTGYQSQHSRVGGTAINTGAPDPIPRPLAGVRANTAAELVRDLSNGELYYFGVNGARVPYVNDELEGVRPDGMGPVLPDDSASQAGDLRKRSAANHNKTKSGLHEDKPAGFW